MEAPLSVEFGEGAYRNTYNEKHAHIYTTLLMVLQCTYVHARACVTSFCGKRGRKRVMLCTLWTGWVDGLLRPCNRWRERRGLWDIRRQLNHKFTFRGQSRHTPYIHYVKHDVQVTCLRGPPVHSDHYDKHVSSGDRGSPIGLCGAHALNTRPKFVRICHT